MCYKDTDIMDDMAMKYCKTHVLQCLYMALELILNHEVSNRQNNPPIVDFIKAEDIF